MLEDLLENGVPFSFLLMFSNFGAESFSVVGFGFVFVVVVVFDVPRSFFSFLVVEFGSLLDVGLWDVCLFSVALGLCLGLCLCSCLKECLKFDFEWAKAHKFVIHGPLNNLVETSLCGNCICTVNTINKED